MYDLTLFLCFSTILWHLITLHPPKTAVFNAHGLSQSLIQSPFLSNFFPYHLWSFHPHALTPTSDLRFDRGPLINPHPGPNPEFYVCRLYRPDANPENWFLERPGASNGDELHAGYIKDP